MAEELIIKCCAPTLAGLKVGSIFCLGKDKYDGNFDDAKELKRCVEILKSKGIEVRGIRGCMGQRLIYLYRPAELKVIVSKGSNACILKSFGYNTDNIDLTVRTLLERLRYGQEFPHEIGLFLGYPTEDVKGYIENKGKNFILSGMWKVYSNRESAEKCFSCYQKCTKVYMKCYHNGTGLDRLTIKK